MKLFQHYQKRGFHLKVKREAMQSIQMEKLPSAYDRPDFNMIS